MSSNGSEDNGRIVEQIRSAALDAGKTAGAFYNGLSEAGVPPAEAVAITTQMVAAVPSIVNPLIALVVSRIADANDADSAVRSIFSRATQDQG